MAGAGRAVPGGLVEIGHWLARPAALTYTRSSVFSSDRELFSLLSWLDTPPGPKIETLAMASRFQILGSSSNGNCSILSTGQTRILIDAGFTAKKIGEALAESGYRLEDIEAVFLTHEHSDHISGLNGLARHSHLRFFATRGTMEGVRRKCDKKFRWEIFESGTTFNFQDLEVSPFTIPHDAYDPVGYVFKNVPPPAAAEQQWSIAWVTDLGHVPNLVVERVRQVGVLVLESNHDLLMLDRDEKRPFAIRQRIKGRHGHLSNESARDLLLQSGSRHWKQVYLAHLSKECNTVDLVRKTVLEALPADRSYTVSIVDPRHGRQQPLDLDSLLSAQE